MHENSLANSRQRLLFRNRRRTLLEPHAIHTGTYRAGRDQQDFPSLVSQIRKLPHQGIHTMQVQLAIRIGKSTGPYLHHYTLCVLQTSPCIHFPRLLCLTAALF